MLKKDIQVNGRDYVLEIQPIYDSFFKDERYQAELADLSIGRKWKQTFHTLAKLHDGLKEFVIYADRDNNQKRDVLQQIEEWDGVIEYEVN